MKITLLVIAVAGIAATDVCAETELLTSRETSNLRLTELQRLTSQLLRRQATAGTARASTAAVRELVSLYRALENDPRIETSPTLSRLHTRLRIRMRGIQRQLEDRANNRFGDSPGSGREGAAGGGAQLANQGDELIELIQATIVPDSWDVNGGESSIRYFAPRHALVVRAPSRVHGSLRGLLLDLRRP